MLATISSRELTEWYAFDLVTTTADAGASAPAATPRPLQDELRRKLERAFPVDPPTRRRGPRG